MRLTANLPYMKNDDVELVVLPLAPEPSDDNNVTLAIVLMLPPIDSDLAKFRSTLAPERFAGWIGQAIVPKPVLEAWEATRPETDLEVVLEKWLTTYPLKSVTLAVPKFTMQTPPRHVDGWTFDAKVGQPGLFVQACAIRVDEFGVGVERGAVPKDFGTIGQPATFEANRPFLVAVVDLSSGAVVLAGQVDRP